MKKGRPAQKVVQQYFEVEKILAKRFVRGNAEYLVKWKDFQQTEATWEAPNNLSSVLDMVLEYEHRAQAEEEAQAEKAVDSQKKRQELPTQTPFFEIPMEIHSDDCEIKVDENHNEQTTEMQGSMRFPEGITFAIDNQAGREAFVNMIQGSALKPTSVPRVIENISVDIAYEAKQADARFQKLAEKCGVVKMSKKQQKEAKKDRKLDATPKKRGGTPTKPVTEILVQNVQQEDSTCQNEQTGCRMQLREKKDNKHKINLKNKGQKKKTRSTHDLPEQELDFRKECSLNNSHSQTPRLRSPHRTPSKEAIERSYSITQIRMLENIPNKAAGEYLVQYESGEMKVLRTVELIVTSPFEFAEYLERKHKI